MFVKLLMLFTIVPVVELYILVKVGQEIGTMNTVALVIITGIAGASFAKSQGAQKNLACPLFYSILLGIALDKQN